MSDFNLNLDLNLYSGNYREFLLTQARLARESAYCRYSGFAVGTALLTASGEVYTGCNIENASYSLCICAERTAFARAVSDGHREFRAIAIIGGFRESGDCPDQSGTDCFPCGACRQFMSEFCKPDFKIYLQTQEFTLGELFPGEFKLNFK